ncbi:MAG: hypothetical protein WDK96_00310 [Candidatus Paceibacterota bacterium]|jgi:hypothetical protein
MNVLIILIAITLTWTITAGYFYYKRLLVIKTKERTEDFIMFTTKKMGVIELIEKINNGHIPSGFENEQKWKKLSAKKFLLVELIPFKEVAKYREKPPLINQRIFKKGYRNLNLLEFLIFCDQKTTPDKKIITMNYSIKNTFRGDSFPCVNFFDRNRMKEGEKKSDHAKFLRFVSMDDCWEENPFIAVCYEMGTVENLYSMFFCWLKCWLKMI